MDGTDKAIKLSETLPLVSRDATALEAMGWWVSKWRDGETGGMSMNPESFL